MTSFIAKKKYQFDNKLKISQGQENNVYALNTNQSENYMNKWVEDFIKLLFKFAWSEFI